MLDILRMKKKEGFLSGDAWVNLRISFLYIPKREETRERGGNIRTKREKIWIIGKIELTLGGYPSLKTEA